MLQHLEKRPEGQWRSNTLWSFKNEDKVSVAAAPCASGSHAGVVQSVMLECTCIKPCCCHAQRLLKCHVQQVYGSPMFDSALARARGGGDDPLPGLLAALRAAPLRPARAAAAGPAAASAAAVDPADSMQYAALGNGTLPLPTSGDSSQAGELAQQEAELAKRRDQEVSDAALARQLQEMDDEIQ